MRPTPPDPRFREARREDLPALVAMLADDALGATREDAADPPAPEYVRAFDAIARSADQWLIVAEIGAAVVGCLQLSVLPNLSQRGMTRAMVEGVRVRADHRGQGIGEAMMAHAAARARAAGAGVMQLTTHASRTGAQRFYARLGFTASHVGMKRALD